MADQVTEVTSRSWFSRLGGAFKGIFIGLLFFLGAFVLLFWNEGRAVKRHRALQEGGGLVATVNAGAVDPSNEGKLVHLTAEATTDETLSDPDFPVSANALRLRRSVEIYQWQESSSSKSRTKVGGGTETVTTYDYKKGWSANLEDSSKFKEPAGHQNPGSVRFDAAESTAANVALGAFTLSESDVQRINDWHDVTVDDAATLPEGTTSWNGGVYAGRDPSSPEVGDVRIRFAAVSPTTISVVGKQEGNGIGSYTTKNGGSIHLLETGVHSAEEMFKAAESSNKTLTWALRVGGFFLMFFGLLMIVSPLKVFADVVPFIGRIVGAGTGLMAFLIAAIFSLGTIGVAWIVYRPLVGIAMFVLMAGVVVLVALRAKRAPMAPQMAG